MSETESPTAQVTRSREPAKSVTDGLGRTLTLRKIGALQKLRLFKACGKQSEVGPYVGLALLASCVESIDGVPVIQPVNEQQVEALVDKLGDEGLEAVGKAMDPGEDSGAVMDAAKN